MKISVAVHSLFYDKIHFWQIWLHRIFDIMHLNWPFICQRWEWLSHLSTLSFLKHLPRLLFLFRNLFWNIWKHFWKHLGRVEQGMIIITDVIWQHRDPNINIKITLEIFFLVDSNFSSSLGMMEEAWGSNSKQIEDENLSVFLFRFRFTKMVQTTFPVHYCCWWYKEYQPVVIASLRRIAFSPPLQSEPWGSPFEK